MRPRLSRDLFIYGFGEIVTIMGDYAMAAIFLTAVDQQLPPDRKPLLPVR